MPVPAVNLVPYCVACDEGRAALAAAAEGPEAQAEVLREHPRRIATKTDVAGTPLCARCLESAAERRKAGFYFDQSGQRDSVF